MIKLFDIENGVLIPTPHCYNLKDLKNIMDSYPDNYMDIYSYIFYMTCPNPDVNPFFDVPEIDKEELIIKQLNLKVSLESPLIIKALDLLNKLYDTPTRRAYMGIKQMLDNLASYMATASITHGRDGNITALVNAAAKFDEVRNSFKGAYKDLMAEQQSSVRGGLGLAYDQKI